MGKGGLTVEEYKEILLSRGGIWKKYGQKKNMMNRKFLLLHENEPKVEFYKTRQFERRVQKKKKDWEMKIYKWFTLCL